MRGGLPSTSGVGDSLKGGEQFDIGFGVDWQIMGSHTDDRDRSHRIDPNPLAMNTNGADFIISKARAVPFAAIGAAIEQACATRLSLPGGAVLMLTEIGDPASRNNLTTTKRTLAADQLGKPQQIRRRKTDTTSEAGCSISFQRDIGLRAGASRAEQVR